MVHPNLSDANCCKIGKLVRAIAPVNSANDNFTILFPDPWEVMDLRSVSGRRQSGLACTRSGLCSRRWIRVSEGAVSGRVQTIISAMIATIIPAVKAFQMLEVINIDAMPGAKSCVAKSATSK